MSLKLVAIFVLITFELSTRTCNEIYTSNILFPTCPIAENVELESPLRIGAWNAQKLGKAKMRKKDVVEVLVQVMMKYDIIIMEEIMDSSETVPYQLLDILNERTYFAERNFDPNDALREPAEDIYDIVISKRIGTTRYKEQYAYYYRQDRVILNETFQYKDEKDEFQVEPFVVVFETPDSEVDRIAFIPIHTSPDNAVIEIDALVDVYDALVKELGIEDAIIIGDFNAGCTYVGGRDWAEIRLRTDKRFQWLITDHVDTTTKGTTCPYDRIVVAGKSMKKAVYEESAKPYYFDDELDLEDEQFVHKVSDHYPIEVTIRSNASSVIKNTKVEIGITVDVHTSTAAIKWLAENCEKVVEMVEEQKEKDRLSVEENDVSNQDIKDNVIQSIEEKEEENEEDSGQEIDDVLSIEEHETQKEEFRCGKNPKIVIEEEDIFALEFYSKNLDEAIDLLDELSSQHPCVITPQGTSILKYKLTHQALSDMSTYYEGLPFAGITTRLFCLHHMCKVLVTKETPVV